MASSLLRAKCKFSLKNVVSHVLQKNPTEEISSSRWRCMMSIAINQEAPEIQNVLPNRETRQNDNVVNIQTLKEKERGDWRFLTMEEKRQLYQMSFSQPVCETVAVDEWKAILGGTFTAMGLITMGIYVWFTQFGFRNLEKVSSLTSEQIAEKHQLMVDFVNEKMGVANFDSLPRN